MRKASTLKFLKFKIHHISWCLAKIFTFTVSTSLFRKKFTISKFWSMCMISIKRFKSSSWLSLETCSKITLKNLKKSFPSREAWSAKSAPKYFSQLKKSILRKCKRIQQSIESFCFTTCQKKMDWLMNFQLKSMPIVRDWHVGTNL